MKAAKYTALVMILTCAFNLPCPVSAHGFADEMMAAGQLNLMPVPASLQTQTGRLPITSSFSVLVKNYADDRLRSGIARMLRRLAGRTVLTFPAEMATDESAATLVVQCDRAGEAVPSLSENESYSLDITDKQARLSAPTVVGALRGLETFLQLVQGDRIGFYLPGIKIQDQPRFPWRGLLIDVGRHYEPMEVLKRNLDAMAAVKIVHALGPRAIVVTGGDLDGDACDLLVTGRGSRWLCARRVRSHGAEPT